MGTLVTSRVVALSQIIEKELIQIADGEIRRSAVDIATLVDGFQILDDFRGQTSDYMPPTTITFVAGSDELVISWIDGGGGGSGDKTYFLTLYKGDGISGPVVGYKNITTALTLTFDGLESETLYTLVIYAYTDTPPHLSETVKVQASASTTA